ncbi:GNAT family N-acetyltransferase [Vibrio sp. V30_P3S12P165]|nr:MULTISPECIES: GNAT family N-acetyltransferase [unclassified Vibrio]NAW68136.1 GNAT family N-acetyltransferase [Vibrio sp. V28_P6S34P95]NAX03991.1 GNAT family N-acetyltransferase [Vibrio sp. V30_P3S12P165]NAX33767.1 GNAT family N-acetyltransferase [Vibrio sp. V29_P1S30P107]
MEIKVAEYKDFERIAHLHAHNWQRHYQGILEQDYLDNEALQDCLLIWQTRLTNPPYNQHILLLEANDRLLGFICAFGNHDVEKGTMIDALHVSPDYQGQGLGKWLIKAMLEWVEHYFPEHGIYLEVAEKNQSALDFYEHIGGQSTLIKTWQAPSGYQLLEKVFTWPSSQVMLQAVS